MIVLPNFDCTEAAATAERIRSSIEAALLSAAVTASIGVAVSSDVDSADDLLKRADVAMYEAKRSSKNRVTVWSDQIVAPPLA